MNASDLEILRSLVARDLEAAKACLDETRDRKSFMAGVRAGQCRSLEEVLTYINTLISEGNQQGKGDAH
jgi:hypothetical protein